MVCKVNCAAIMGVDVLPVIVEPDICNGLPSFDMVGLLSYDIKESRELKILRELTDLELLKKEGKSKGSYYVLQNKGK